MADADKRAEFNAALKESLKAKDQVAISTIRLILAALKDRDISAKGQGKAEGIGDSEILSMLQSMIKQRNESTKTYRDAEREDLAQREEQEIQVIEKFLPQQLNEGQINNVIDDLIAKTGARDIKDMGKVMGALKQNYAGQLDMGLASKLLKEKLA